MNNRITYATVVSLVVVVMALLMPACTPTDTVQHPDEIAEASEYFDEYTTAFSDIDKEVWDTYLVQASMTSVNNVVTSSIGLFAYVAVLILTYVYVNRLIANIRVEMNAGNRVDTEIIVAAHFLKWLTIAVGAMLLVGAIDNLLTAIANMNNPRILAVEYILQHVIELKGGGGG